jgi:hypothetical protein
MSDDLSRYVGSVGLGEERGFATRTKNRKAKPPRLKQQTGTGKKSSGKRTRCAVAGCQAFESPAKSGYCSFHESKALAVGEKPAVLKNRKCAKCSNFTAPPVGTDDEYTLCDDCEYYAAHPEEDDRLDGEL